MNSILQTLLFTAPFYNLISLIGAYTSEDLSGRTPLLDAMVSYLSEFKTSNPERESQLGRGESYEEQLQKNDAFIPSIIYHALNNNARFAQMGFSTGSASASGINHSYSTSSAPLTKANLSMNTNHLSQEDAQEFLGFFLDTIHEELLIKTEAWDKQRWEKANRGIRAGMDSLARQSVNSIDEYENSLLASQAQAPQGMSNPAPVTSQPNGAGADSASVSAAGDDEWLEVGQKGRTATTRTTQTQESAVTRIFGGKLRSVLRCPGQKDSVTLEPFMSLQLEIQVGRVQYAGFPD
jgi:ubiquitin carboxyl-terminal hydrolase 10